MKHTKIKICGVKTIEVANFLATTSVTAIGVVFYRASKRYITPEDAQKILIGLPSSIVKVGLFVNPKSQEVERTLNIAPLDVLQFHGQELEADCTRYGLPYIKALPVDQKTDLVRLAGHYRGAAALLLDSYSQGQFGGSGKTFDHARVNVLPKTRVIVAGGLTPKNVGQAIAALSPYAVDVSSGVENADGVKDIGKIRAFIQAVSEADSR